MIRPSNRYPRVAATLVGLGLLAGCSSVPIDPAPAPPVISHQPSPLPRTATADQAMLDSLHPVALSANFVDRVIHDLPVEAHLARFAALEPASLDAQLDTQTRQLAFWINVYNGYTQYFLKADPGPYLDNRSAYFGAEQIHIAGDHVSLEDIEHGVLRRGATIYTLGHVRMLWWRRAFIRRFAVESVDYRLHFALNCGALSCPPVMAYQAERLDEQLDANSRFYLGNAVEYDRAANVVRVPALMRWFSADFGGSATAKRSILRRYGLLPAATKPKLAYLPYDWTMAIENYAVTVDRPPSEAGR